MTRTPIRKRTPTMANRRADNERDGAGMTMADVASWLPERTADWPAQQDVKRRDAYRVIVRLFSVEQRPAGLFGECWLCGQWRYLDICHIVSRSNELANLFLACTCDPSKACYPDSCHARVEKPTDGQLREILRAKLAKDFAHTSFLRLAQLRRRKFGFDSLD